MHSLSRKLFILTLITLTALFVPMAQAKGGGGGGRASGAAGGGTGAGRATGAGRGVSGVGGYGGGGYNYGTSSNQDPQAPKKVDQASDTSNYGRGSTK
jgi:hypothetical protein